MALMRSAATVPVHMLSGFLGSGKTTLLNWLLAALPAGTRPAIVVNDFGAVTVDGALVDRDRYAVAELASGCVCCTLSAPLQEALSALLDEEWPDTILMETTGLAEPAAFPALFAAPELAADIHLGNVVCVVDASTYLRYADHLLVLPRQVEQANTVIMNKVDLTDAATRDAVRRRLLATCPPGTLLLAAERCAVDPRVIVRRASVLLRRRRPPRRPPPGVSEPDGRTRASGAAGGATEAPAGAGRRSGAGQGSGAHRRRPEAGAAHPRGGGDRRLAGAAGGLAHHLRRPGSPGTRSAGPDGGAGPIDILCTAQPGPDRSRRSAACALPCPSDRAWPSPLDRADHHPADEVPLQPWVHQQDRHRTALA